MKLEDLKLELVKETELTRVENEISHTAYYDGNTHSILTHLIQRVGALCENYASDLFIDWSSFKHDADHDELLDEYWFGIRDYGVDHKPFIEIRLEESKKNYKEIYVMKIGKLEDEIYKTRKLKFYKVVS